MDNKYWEKRKAQRMFEYMQEADEVADEIAKAYFKSSEYINHQIDEIYTKFKRKHSLSDSEARMLLNKSSVRTSLDSVMIALKQEKYSDEKKGLLKLIESPAYAGRIRRLQEVQEDVDNIVNNIYRIEKQRSTSHYVSLSDDVYYKTIFDIQKHTGYAFRFTGNSAKDVNKMLNSKWSGINYSERIWRNTSKLAQEVKEELLINLLTGRSEYEVSNIIANKFATSAMEARRLVRTESAYVSNEMEQHAYEESGIDKYIFVATLDMKTSDVCRSMDGKKFLVSKRQPGRNCPPMHPWCRSTTIGYLNDEVLANMKRRARNPETGETYEVPANMNYEKWYGQYVEHSVKPPYKDDLDIPFQKNRKNDIPYKTTNHVFTNGTYDLDEDYSMKSKMYELNNGCRIFVPDSLDERIQPINVSDVSNVLQSMPNEITKYLCEVEIVDYSNPQDSVIAELYGKKGFVSAAIGGDRKVTLFPAKNNRSIEQIENILYHESGHILEDEFFKEKGILISDSSDYFNVVQLDKRKTGESFASKYAKSVKNYREDLADSIKFYYLNSEKFKERFPNRHRFIKEWMLWIQKK